VVSVGRAPAVLPQTKRPGTHCAGGWVVVLLYLHAEFKVVDFVEDSRLKCCASFCYLCMSGWSHSLTFSSSRRFVKNRTMVIFVTWFFC